jgi:anti-sigma factor RsiW
MSETHGPVNEDELHAYVDQQIDAGRLAVIEAYLRGHPDVAQRIAVYQRQRSLLREALSPFAVEPVPPRLKLDHIIGERLRRRQQPLWRLAAMIVLAIGLGGVAGWYLRAPLESGRATSAIASLRQEAIATHIVYSVDRRHPIEVSAAERDHLKQWLSNRLHRVIAPPDLSSFGYKLLGGRLLATEQGRPAALFMYEGPDKERLSVVMRPMAPQLYAAPTDLAQGAINGSGWIDDGLGFAVVAELPEADLERIARQIKAEQNAPPRQSG